MLAAHVVVLTIDRLGAAWLGPYGNTWIETPNFNRLAASSVLCEWMLADSPALVEIFRSYLTGKPAVAPLAAENAPSLATLAASASNTARFITDDAEVGTLAESAGWQTDTMDAIDNSTSADSVEQTATFAFFAEAIAALGRAAEPGILWLHSRGMSGPWDAPLEFRNHFADEDDPEPPKFVEPPNKMLADGFDPDELLGIVQAYAGQVTLIDLCLGMFLDALDEHPRGNETLLIVTSPRGYPLGEHRRVGSYDGALYGELLHVPLLVRFPNKEHALTRMQSLLQPTDLFSLVGRAIGPGESTTKSQIEEGLRTGAIDLSRFAHATGPNQRAIRTPAWYLRESQTELGPNYELFAKPDDRWEANEVSSRCGEVVELLAAELDRLPSAEPSSNSQTPPLNEVLYDKWR